MMKRFISEILILSISMICYAQSAPSGNASEGQIPPPPPNDSVVREGGPQRHPRITASEVTERMIAELNLDEKQAKKVEKLNKKHASVIEGIHPQTPDGQKPPKDFAGGGRGGHGGRMGGGPGGMGGPPPGGGMGGGPGGGPGGMGGPPSGGMNGEMPRQEDFGTQLVKLGKKQEDYDKKLAKILSADQMTLYETNIKPQYASQWQMQEYIMFGR